ncbi:efflux RND transporter periplasmic adaptor subunit [Undibacterium sp. TJN25]|uniref:efflux RND transporter periplasmic adaptor subunit n=1 Tax=Undibacterium sp. TJN25 TaxID=3413056 RepID=UPI003BF3E475
MFSLNKMSRYAPAAIAGLALVCAGCDSKKPDTTQDTQAAMPVEVNVLAVRHSSVPVTQQLPGRTTAYLVAQVRARVDGIVQKRRFQEGADVTANQPLYQIDAAPFRAALDSAQAAQQKAEANLATTKAQAERYKILVGANAVSKQAFDNAVSAEGQAAADVAAANAAAETARINLGYTNVTSPITGRSNISQVTQGAYVQASAATLMTTIQQIDPIYVDLNEPSIAGMQLRRDLASGRLKSDGTDAPKLTLTLEDGTQYPLKGTLQVSGTTVDSSTGSVTLRAVFPNPKYVLLPGMFVRARIEEGVNDAAFLVPASAVTHNAKGEATVLVVSAGNKITERTVQAPNTLRDQWVITAGLSEGDNVVVGGAQKTHPGMLVHPVGAAIANGANIANISPGPGSGALPGQAPQNPRLAPAAQPN